MNFQDAINAQKSGELQKADKIYKKLLNLNPEKSYWYPEAILYRQKDANDEWKKILHKLGNDLDLIKINK